MRRSTAWVGGIAVVLAGCVSRPRAVRPGAPTAVAEPPGWRSVSLGLCEDYPEESRTLERAKKDLAAAEAAGAKVLRISFGWDAMEPERGNYDWSFWDEFVRSAVDNHGLTLIPYVCYTPKWAASDPGEDSNHEECAAHAPGLRAPSGRPRPVVGAHRPPPPGFGPMASRGNGGYFCP